MCAVDATQNQWYRLEVLINDAETCSDLLWSLNAAGVEVQDHETFMEGDTILPVPDGKARLIAFFAIDEPHDTSAANLQKALENAFEAAKQRIDIISFQSYHDTSWETAWMAYFKPTLISNRVIVGPPWEDFEAPENGTKLIIEPGMAFGTGTHETTQLCAAMMDDRLLDSRGSLNILDVGCGSAILSMAAARLGAGRIIGIDVDAHAVGVAKENLIVNSLADDVTLSTTPLESVTDQFDLVIANILARILLTIKDGLYDRLADNGVMIISGITTEQSEEFIRDFLKPGYAVIKQHTRGEWVAFQIEPTSD